MATKSTWRGINWLWFFENSTKETVQAMAPVQFYEDFLGADTVIPAAGSPESGVHWVSKIVGAAPPVLAKVADAAGGQVSAALTSASQKQDAALTMNDQREFDVTKGLIFEARIKLSVLPSAAGVQAVWGLSGDWIDGPDNTTYYLEFGATANGNILIRKQDGVAQTSTATTVTLTATDWAICKIDATDVTSVKFYVNGAQVGTAAFAATGANAVLQPKVAVYKPSGTGVATILTDYVRIWQNR